MALGNELILILGCFKPHKPKTVIKRKYTNLKVGSV